jgi:hypothetical protein
MPLPLLDLKSGEEGGVGTLLSRTPDWCNLWSGMPGSNTSVGATCGRIEPRPDSTTIRPHEGSSLVGSGETIDPEVKDAARL